MIDAVGRLADRLLVRVAPRIEAAAGCEPYWQTCYCSGGVLFARDCYWGCSGIPDGSCGSCRAFDCCYFC